MAVLLVLTTGSSCQCCKKPHRRSIPSVESKEMESFSLRCYAAHCVRCCC